MLYKEIVDLAWTYANDLAVFPGGAPMRITKQGNTHRGDAMEITTVDNWCLHYGTHMDCPAHMVQGGARIEEFSPEHFIGRGRVLDLRSYPEGSTVGKECLADANLEGIEFLLFNFGWEKFIQTENQFGKYPVFSMELAEYLGNSKQFKGFGIEMGNYDHIGDEEFPIHRTLMKNHDKLLYESLRNLDCLIGRDFLFVGQPLKIKHAEGGPVRPLALVM